MRSVIDFAVDATADSAERKKYFFEEEGRKKEGRLKNVIKCKITLYNAMATYKYKINVI